MIVAGLVLVWGLSNPLLGRIERILATFYARADSIRIDTVDGYTEFMTSTVTKFAIVMVIPFGMFILFALTASIMQTGLVFTAEKLSFDLNRLNPLERTEAHVLPAVAGRPGQERAQDHGGRRRRAAGGLSPVQGDRGGSPASVGAMLAFLHDLLSRLLMAIAMMVTVIAAADYFYQRFAFTRKLKMTKQEVKDEQKQTEGDPMVKARLRALRMQRARQRMMAAVPKADVVITNPTHFACALKYDMELMGAPTLVAKGQELIALRIRQIAQENDIPIVENPPLASALYATVELDQEIPPQHYKAVAEVISYVFRLKGKIRK